MEQLNTGIPEMKIANLFEDVKILKEIQELSNKILEDDPKLEKETNAKLQKLIEDKFTQRIDI